MMAATKRIAVGAVVATALVAALAGCSGSGPAESAGAGRVPPDAKKARRGGSQERGPAHRRRLHRVHRSPAGPAQAASA